MAMPLHPTWEDVGVRLILTLLAAAMIGYDREAGGHAAGFRTTVLVGLAAAIAMIQANILLAVSGKDSASFGVMDLMRLPLGILTGVGFIGGGAILRRGDLVTGVTTAATLWIVTVIGLCFGGGQLGLGGAGTIITLITLWALKWSDRRIRRMHRGILSIVAASEESGRAVANLVRSEGYDLRFLGLQPSANRQDQTLSFEIRWTGTEVADPPFDLLTRVSQHHRIESFALVDQAGH